MEIVAEGVHVRRHPGRWAVAVAAAVAVFLVALALTIGAAGVRPTGVARDSRGRVSVAPALGRPHAYHSTRNPGCAKGALLPKRGRVCLDPARPERR
ncbi:MAG: hypothetical protein ABR529_14240 [Actinomycetota bacterium]